MASMTRFNGMDGMVVSNRDCFHHWVFAWNRIKRLKYNSKNIRQCWNAPYRWNLESKEFTSESFFRVKQQREQNCFKNINIESYCVEIRKSWTEKTKQWEHDAGDTYSCCLLLLRTRCCFLSHLTFAKATVIFHDIR